MKPLTLVAALLAAVPAWPQDAPTLTSGDKVRFLTVSPAARRLTATVVEVQSDALLVRTSANGAPTRIALPDLDTLEVARGRRSQFDKGFVLGLVPGALFGLLIGLHNCDDGYCESSIGLALGAAVVCGGVTGLVGGIIGSVVGTDNWVKVPADPGRGPRIDIGVMPARGGVAGQLSVTF